MGSSMILATIYLSPELHKEVHDLAKAADVDFSQVIRLAVKKWLESDRKMVSKEPVRQTRTTVYFDTSDLKLMRSVATIAGCVRSAVSLYVESQNGQE